MDAKPQRTRATPSKKEGPNFALPLTTVDVVIFTVLDGELQVLLVQRPQDEIGRAHV
jgi:hypothetical protein